MYLDNDHENIYLAIVTSCPFQKDWNEEPGISGAPTGIGVYEVRYADTALISPYVIPGDIVIDFGLNPRDEKGEKVTSYDFGIDLVHEQRNPKDPTSTDIWNDPYQHAIQGMRDMSLGNRLYTTTADPGGIDIGDPYLDLTGNPIYDWYTANVHAESEWQHTNFDPTSSWGTMPNPIGNCTTNYYKYEFPGGYRENNADTYIIECIIPLSVLETGGATIQPGETTINIQWITGCRNEGVTAAYITKILDLESVNIVEVTVTGHISQQEIEDSDSATVITAFSSWNTYDDDGVVTLSELQDAIDHWVNDSPKNGHFITLSELQDLVALWLGT
jgi:hypothetical protein